MLGFFWVCEVTQVEQNEEGFTVFDPETKELLSLAFRSPLLSTKETASQSGLVHVFLVGKSFESPWDGKAEQEERPQETGEEGTAREKGWFWK